MHQASHHHVLHVVVTAGIGALVCVLISFAFPFEWSATARLLVVQRTSATLDPYTALRSTELIGEGLSSLVTTSTFFDAVLASNSGVDASMFSLDERQRRKQWNRMISARMEQGTGFMRVTAWNTNRDQSEAIVRAIATVLGTEASTLAGRDVFVRLVDAPLVSRFPTRPNIPLIALAGAVVGAGVGGGISFAATRRTRRVHEVLAR